jgi:DNA-binding MarR family transcriptional regulator
MEDHADIIIQIRKLVRSVNLESKQIQKDFGISIPQLLCLKYLSQTNNYQGTHKELTEYLNLNSSTVTGIINRLEKKGLVARLPKKEDKRLTNISLTSAGYQLLENTPALLHNKLLKRVYDLPEDEILSIKDSLKKLVALLGIEKVDASALLIVEEPAQQEE